MTTTQQRNQVVGWILDAVNAGARRPPACEIVGITVRTLQRWSKATRNWNPIGTVALNPDKATRENLKKAA